MESFPPDTRATNFISFLSFDGGISSADGGMKGHRAFAPWRHQGNVF
jgi:hypothetical protein